MTRQAQCSKPTSFVSFYCTTFMVGVTMISLGPLLDSILKDLQIPLAQGGLISVAFAVGMLIGVMSLNFMLARVSVKCGLVGAAVLQAAGFVASGLLARGLGSLMAAYLFVGVGCVFLNSLPGMWITSHLKIGAEQAMVTMLVFFALGMMVAPLIIGAVLGWGASWRDVFLAEGVMSAALALLVAASSVSNIEGRENLRLRRLWEVIGFNPRLFVAVLGASILYIGAEFTFNVWLAKYEIDVFAAQKATAGLAVTLFWVGLLIGRLVVIPLTRKVPAALILAAGAATWSAFALGVALSVSAEMSMVMAFCAGLGASAGFPLILSFSARFPKWHAGVVFSSVIMAGALGRIIFPYLVGPLAETLGFRLAMGLAFVLAGGLSVVALYLRRLTPAPREG
jgi:fucose permease